MKKLLLALFVALCFLAPAVLAHIDNAGYIEANLDSVTSSYTPHNWGDLPELPGYRKMTKPETDSGCDLTVGFRVRDDSRLAGYSNKVEGSLYYFNFATQAWVAIGNTFTKSGSNTKTGKYNEFASNTWRLSQPYPVTKYSLGLVSDTRGVPTKRVWKEFYVAKDFPFNTYTNYYYENKSSAVRRAAPSWYASRMELAQMLRRFKTEWDQMASSNQATINFDEEMKKILSSAASLAAPTTPGEYAQNAGLEALQLASSVFASVTTSSMVAAGGEIYGLYQMYKWCGDTLNSSMNTYNSAMGGLTMRNAVWAANNVPDSPPRIAPSFDLAISAVEADANELVRIVYTSPNDPATTWKACLVTERDAFGRLMVAITQGRGTDTGVGADGYLVQAGATATKDKIDKYFDLVWNIAAKEKALLDKATL